MFVVFPCEVQLPAEVRKSPVGLRHLVDVFALLDNRTRAVVGVYEFSRESVGHRQTLAVARPLR